MEYVQVVLRGDAVSVGHEALLDRLSEEGRAALVNLEGAAHHLRIVEKDVRDCVADARSVGLSWHVIGVSLGITGEGARKRYSGASDGPG